MRPSGATLQVPSHFLPWWSPAAPVVTIARGPDTDQGTMVTSSLQLATREPLPTLYPFAKPPPFLLTDLLHCMEPGQKLLLSLRVIILCNHLK